MLSQRLLTKFSTLFYLMTLSKLLPFSWDPYTFTIALASFSSRLLWLIVLIHSLAHCLFVSTSLVLYFHKISSPQKAIHLLWICGSSVLAVLQFSLLIQSRELIQFFNRLIRESIATSDRLQRNNSSRVEFKRNERLLELILVSFVSAGVFFPAFILAVFLFNPLQPQLLCASLSTIKQIRSHLALMISCGLYEVCWTTYTWTTLIFFLFQEFTYFFLSQALLNNYRSGLKISYGTKRWVIDYRSLQVFQVQFNDTLGRIALPFHAFVFCLCSLVGNYCSIVFFHIELHLFVYLYFPFVSLVLITYELIMYPWIGSIHFISSSPDIRFRRVWRNPGGFHSAVASAYARSLTPLKVKLGLFRNISKFSILSLMTFTIVSTARLVILFPMSNSSWIHKGNIE